MRGIRWRLNTGLAAGLLFAAVPGLGKDRYSGFAALQAAEKPGEAFRVTARDRGAPVTVLAVHGGGIEAGTAEVARAVAQEDWNLYLLEGLLGQDDGRLHVTSKHFDDPAAVALATAAVLALSVHGSRDEGEGVCVGGSARGPRRRVAQALRAGGFSVEEPCRRLPGRSRRNIVNRAQRGGVQLELARGLRGALARDAGRLQAFCAHLRRGLQGALAP